MDSRNDSIQTAWSAICSQLQQKMGDRFAVRWLSKIVPDSIEDNCVNLLSPSPCIHELVKQNYSAEILALWQKENPEISGLHFKLAPQTPVASGAAPIILKAPKTAVQPISARPALVEDESLPSLLDPTHTFDTFVVGESNKMAATAARHVAESDGLAFNPLYIHGGVGLGKTHLMHAIAWRMRETSPDKKVLYLSAEQFFHRFIQALRIEKDIRSFQERLRSVDALLIDDIQFIFGKTATQSEFSQTFNALIAEGKKIILSADKSPADLQGVDERLRSRMTQGLVVEILPTDYELRLNIAKEKARRLNKEIPLEVLEFLARNVTANVRELEGAITRITAHADFMNTPINIETTKDVLRDILNVHERQVSVPDIQKMVAEYYSLTIADLKSVRRERRIVRPRQLAMFLAKELTPLSFPDIAMCFGRDHTTVMHAIRTIEDLLPRDERLARDLDILKSKLKEETHG